MPRKTVSAWAFLQFQRAAIIPARIRRSVVSAAAPAVHRFEACAGRNAPVGSTTWLRAAELRYGGIVTNLPRGSVSPLDPRSPEQIATGGNIGGDRMSWLHHNYAPTYAEYLERWTELDVGPVIVEVGILRGSGLAMWCDLFPSGTVIGLDFDLARFEDNLPELHARGAFRHNSPRVLFFDSYAPNLEALADLLDGRKIDIVMDDGPHSIEAITVAAAALKPLLADRFTYFVEDNPDSFGPVTTVLSPNEARRDSRGLIVLYS